MNLDAYLRRIGLDLEPRPHLATLRGIVSAHVTSVPFENLDVQLGRSTDTDPERAFEKIVERGRGGWCYEQNGLLGHVLESIGFRVTRLSAAVRLHERGPSARHNHLTLAVEVPGDDRRWLADVGFGSSLLDVMPMAESTLSNPPYDLALTRLDTGEWQFDERAKGADGYYVFRDEPADEDALADRCRGQQTEPDSPFVLNLVAKRRGPDHHVSLRGRVLTRIDAAGRTDRVLRDATELVDALVRHFDLDVPEAATLWPRICARHEELGLPLA